MPLKPAVSAPARQTIKTAFDQLDKTILPDDSRQFSTMTLEDVRKTALELENQLAARRSLRNMGRLLPLFNGLEHYAHVLDVLCNGTPYLPWVWAPITLILRVASEYVEAFEKLIKGYARIADCLGRFSLLAQTLKGNLEFQSTLAAFYADILQFHGRAYQFVRRKSWKLLFLTSWGRFERKFDNILEDMKRHEKLVDLHANALSISDIREMKEDIKSWREESIAQIQRQNEKQTTKQYESIIAWLKSEESDQLAILDTISAEGAKFAGTASWALNNPKIKSWLQHKPDQGVLWLHGTPGSGKSVLSSQIVKFMKNPDANTFLIHHFCSQRYSSSITYEEILRSILLQLLRKDDELVAHVHAECVVGKKPPTIQALERLLLHLFKIASREPRQTDYIWIIIDGLNECEPRRQLSVVNLINQITNNTAGMGDTICKVLISSRNSAQITMKLRKNQIVSLTEEKSNMKRAIRQYVSQRLRSMHEILCQLELTRKDIDEIECVITNKADGMFLYARLVLDYLTKNIFFSGKEMKASIDELPKELTEFYRKILTQILIQLDPRSVERIKCIFSWIAFAKRPLKMLEFLSALTFSSGDPTVKSLVPKYVLGICGALVEERPDTTLTFIHISVKEFLQSPASNLVILEDEALTEHCISIMTCLRSGVDYFLPGEKSHHEKAHRVVKGLHGLHIYATEFWTEYLLPHVSMPSSDRCQIVLQLASDVTQELDKIMNIQEPSVETPQTDLTDERLKLLDKVPLLKKSVTASLGARSLSRLENNLEHELRHHGGTGKFDDIPTRNTKLIEGDGISIMLSSYQELVRFLLKQDQYPGISADELDLFKSQFQNSAFTCRLSFCPRATVGFVSEELRRQHEIAHTQLSTCAVPGCQYPPFRSTKALKNHISRHHSPRPARSTIRRVGNIPVRRTWNSTGTDQASEAPQTPDSDMKDEKVIEYQVSDALLRTTKRNRRQWGEDSPKAQQKRKEKSETPNSTVQSRKEKTWKSDGHFPIRDDAIGVLGCAIPGCGEKLNDGNAHESSDDYASEFLSLHYWNWHHADSMARCAVSNCQKIFPDRHGLQTHYTKKHTTTFCSRCHADYGLVGDHSEGFSLKRELRHHWRTHHLQLSKRYVCRRKEMDQLENLGVIFKYVECESCSDEHKFDRVYDAFKHLRAVHLVDQGDGTPREIPNESLRAYIEEVLVYHEANDTQIGHADSRLASESEDTDESSDVETAIKVDDMFYVAELA